MKKFVFIYALIDPRTSLVRYIGASAHPKRRLVSHLYSPGKGLRAHWFSELKALGLRPCLELLDEVPESKWQFWEMEYIKAARKAGMPLVNVRRGGNGGSRRGNRKNYRTLTRPFHVEEFKILMQHAENQAL